MSVRIIQGDCRDVLRTMDAKSVQCCVTSPPYFGLRDYGVAGQIGLEETIEAFIAKLVAVFSEVRRVLRDDGTLWLNLGDSYNSGSSGGLGGSTISGGQRNQSHSNRNGRRRITELKAKDMIGIPWRVAFALQADGWYLRSDIIWAKPNPMPESATDRPTKSHEHLFLLSKRARYFYDADAIAEPVTGNAHHRGKRTSPKTAQHNGREGGVKNNVSFQDATRELVTRRNARDVWTMATHPYAEAHFATFPPALVEPCIKAGSRQGDIVLDPFAGAGTTGLVADRLGRGAVLIELNPEYAEMARRRITNDAPMFAAVDVS